MNSCQTAENVIKSINLILAEALAQNDVEKVEWCHRYIEKIRNITLEKFDDISVQIMTYFESFTQYTDEEREAERLKNPSHKNVNLTQKNLVKLVE